ncbi:MAG: CPBP family intramembrane metalloprotease [Fidelibacterota bacterium]|nr:MAG: CPBP family intramembrane metalloprotease [Candidatus Neomarinimicrobiota bacterium]
MSESLPIPAAARRSIILGGLVGTGMILFALFSHQGFPLILLSVTGLLVAALCISLHLSSGASVSETFGFSRFRRKVGQYALLGVFIGLSLGIIYRWAFSATPMPPRLGWFVLVAALIGSAEELLYRGYLQSLLHSLGSLPAVAVAALFHSGYKGALFAVSSFPLDINLRFLVIATFLAGLAFGAMRERSGHIAPSITAHACFDIIVYSELSKAPWWVWS